MLSKTMTSQRSSYVETKRNFDGAVQHAKACIGRDDLVLKSKQVEVLKALYQGKDCFVWLPTGYGKIKSQLLPFYLTTNVTW